MGVWSSSGPHCGSRCRLARLAAVESVGFKSSALSFVRRTDDRYGLLWTRRRTLRPRAIRLKSEELLAQVVLI